MKNPRKSARLVLYLSTLHTKNETIGEVWLRVVVEKKNNLSMQMWATDKITYEKAINGSDKLKYPPQ